MVKSSLKKKPLVSIIINCYNGEKYLDECIKSVLNQSYKKWEIIFFDNNSKDQSSLLLKKYKDKRIRYFKTNKNFRLYKARNLAIKKCKGELVSFLDVDDWWSSNKLIKQVKVFSNNQTLDILYSNLYLYDEKKKNKKIYISKKLYNGKITQDLIDSFKMPILTTVIKRKVFEKIKFDNRYTIIGDFDLFVRLSLIKNIRAIQEPLAYYRIHDFNLSKIKLNLEISELENWAKEMTKKNNFRFINFSKFYGNIQLLKIINFTLKRQNLLAIKLIFKKPFRVLKLFKFLIFFLKLQKY